MCIVKELRYCSQLSTRAQVLQVHTLYTRRQDMYGKIKISVSFINKLIYILRISALTTPNTYKCNMTGKASRRIINKQATLINSKIKKDAVAEM